MIEKGDCKSRPYFFVFTYFNALSANFNQCFECAAGTCTHSFYSITAVSTERIGGKKFAIKFHESPSSRLAKSCPVLLPT